MSLDPEACVSENVAKISKIRLTPKLMYPKTPKNIEISLHPEACISENPENTIPYIGTKIILLPLFSHNSTQKASLNEPRVKIYTKISVDYESAVNTTF